MSGLTAWPEHGHIAWVSAHGHGRMTVRAALRRARAAAQRGDQVTCRTLAAAIVRGWKR